jgi:hypothetical protein
MLSKDASLILREIIWLIQAIDSDRTERGFFMYAFVI